MTKEKLLRTPEKDLRLTQIGKESMILSLKVQKPIIPVFIDYWDSSTNGVKVHFGKNLIGFIPKEEFTDEPLKFKEDTPVQVLQLLGKKALAQVEDYNTKTNVFLLSRKASMQQAREIISKGEQFNARIVNITDRSIFADCGAGVIGRIAEKDFSMTPYQSLRKSGFEKGDRILVEVLEKTDDRIKLSRIKCYPTYRERKEEFKENSNILCYVSKEIPSAPTDSFKHSYFVEIEPNVSGILNTNKSFECGELVDARIVAVKRRGLKLRY